MFLLDTNICIYIIKKKPIQVLDTFQKLPPGQVAISSITLSELLFGVEKSVYPDRNRKALEKFLIPLEIANYDANASIVYGRIRKHLESKGTPIGSLDTLIAAHAISLNSILITNNEKEFCRVPDLIIENWIK